MRQSPGGRIPGGKNHFPIFCWKEQNLFQGREEEFFHKSVFSFVFLELPHLWLC